MKITEELFNKAESDAKRRYDTYKKLSDSNNAEQYYLQPSILFKTL